MYAVSMHFTLLAINSDDGSLAQVCELGPIAGRRPVEFSPAQIAALDSAVPDGGEKGTIIADGPLKGFVYVKSGNAGFFHLYNKAFVSVPPKMKQVTVDREKASLWETFRFVDEKTARALLGVNGQKEEAFALRVKGLIEARQPVLLHFGCGLNRHKGFLNIDKFSNFGDPEDYYLFDFAEKPWPVEDSSVDYIYSEDFIEHIPQRNQVGFLAEAYRVLKPNAYHRVSTPCLIESMKVHSDFSKGFRGVYFDEFDLWDHLCLFTRGSMNELARVVGYRQVFFTAKSHGTSAFAVADTRPAKDRDQLTGNIYADLLK